VAVAALFPAILYYLGIYMQVDFFARKNNLQGLPKSEVPKLLPVLKDGFLCIFGLLLLIYLLYLRMESQAPFYASLALIALAMMKKRSRLSLKAFETLLLETGKMLAGLIAILAACGFIIGAFSLTGVGSSLSRELVQLAGGNVFMMLIFGAIASFVLGMGMTVTACYIFLAIILAPAIINAGQGHFNLMAVHLFILYWGIVSFITPPVALGSYTAAGIAGAAPFQTGLTSTRLGMVKYIVPFFFVYRPALIFQATLMEGFYFCTSTFIGIVLLAGGFEGYLYWFGRLSLWGRLCCIAAGFLIAMPSGLGSLIGAGLLLGYVGVSWTARKLSQRSV
ncbi:MAG: TRAP transporter large permease subunit, partial [bacterium]